MVTWTWPSTRPRVKRPGAIWTLSVRALVAVALLLIGHDAMMTSPAAAHGNQFEGHYAITPMSAMSMPTDVSDHLEPASAHVASGPIDDPTPDPDEGDCGVLREAALPGLQEPALPDANHLPDIVVPISHVLTLDSPVARPVARAPTLDPQKRRALLQIYRV